MLLAFCSYLEAFLDNVGITLCVTTKHALCVVSRHDNILAQQIDRIIFEDCGSPKDSVHNKIYLHNVVEIQYLAK